MNNKKSINFIIHHKRMIKNIYILIFFYIKIEDGDQKYLKIKYND